MKFDEQRISRISFWFVFLVALAISLLGLFDRHFVAHDELINTFKAHTGLIWDYAGRPLFYSINVLAYKFLGNHPFSLLFVGAASFFATALLLYQLGKRLGGTFCGFVACFALLSSTLAFNIGIKALPHMSAGLMSVVAFFAWHIGYESDDERKAGIWFFATGLLALVCLALHPTMVALVFGINLWFGLCFLLSFVSFAGKRLTRYSFKPYLAGIIASGLASAVYVLLYEVFYGQDYISVMAEMSAWVQDSNRYRRLHAEWYFYFVNFAKEHSILFALGVISGLTGVWLVFKRKANLGYLGFFTVVTIASLAVLSFITWKMERVLVSYTPLLSILIAAAVGTVTCSPNTDSRISIVVKIVTTLALIVGFKPIVDSAVEFRASPFHRPNEFLGLYNQLMTIKETKIGHLGTSKTRMYALRYATITHKELVPLGHHKRYLGPDGTEKFRKKLIATGVNHVLLDVMARQIKREDSDMVITLFKAAGGTTIYNWRGRLELWKFPVTDDFSDIAKEFARIYHHSPICLWSGDMTIPANVHARRLIQTHQLDLELPPPDSMWSTQALKRAKIRYCLFPRNSDDKGLNEFRAKLRTAKAEPIAKSEQMNLELWFMK